MAKSRFSDSWVNVAEAAPGNARTTTWEPLGNLFRTGITKCRNCRVTRCLITEFPTFLPTAKATFDCSEVPCATCKTTNFAENLVPDFITVEISDDLRNLAEAGSIYVKPIARLSR